MRVRQREKAYSITQLKEYLPEYDNRLTYIETAERLLDASDPARDRPGEPRTSSIGAYFPIETQELQQKAMEEGQKASVKLNALLAIQNRLEGLQQAPRPRAREALAGPLRPDAGPDRRLPGQGLRVSRPAWPRSSRSPPCPRSQPGPDLMITWVVDHAREPRPPRTRPPRSTPKPSGCSRQSSRDHPKTPWADLAQDTLNRGFSVRLNEWHHNPEVLRTASSSCRSIDIVHQSAMTHRFEVESDASE